MPSEHKIDLRVYYEDTDAGGIVYHASYLKFAERGRTELLRHMGFSHAQLLKDTGVAFAVINMNVDFKAPARLDDLLTVKSAITDMQGASLGMAQEIRRGDVLLVKMDLRLACLDQQGKAARLPAELKKLFDLGE